MMKRNKTSGIVLIVLGGILILEQLVPNGFWSGLLPFWKPLFDIFDSFFVWKMLLCALGVLWLIDAVRKRRYVQAGFALVLTLTSFRDLLNLNWIPFWPFVPAVALAVIGVVLLCSGTGQKTWKAVLKQIKNAKESHIMEFLKVEDLCKVYGKGESQVAALNHVSLTIERGEFTAIIGSSGSGKSTLLHAIAGVDVPTSGKVYLEGQDVYAQSNEKLAIFRRRQVGLIYQFHNLIPTLNVVENITLPILMDKRKVNKAEAE